MLRLWMAFALLLASATAAFSQNNNNLSPEAMALGREAVPLAREGSALIEQGRYAEGEALLRRALGIYEKILPPNHHIIGLGLNKLGEAVSLQGRYQEAELLLQKAHGLFLALRGPDDAFVAPTASSLANSYQLQGRYDEAEKFARQSLAIRVKLGQQDTNLLNSHLSLGNILLARASYPAAEKEYTRALELAEAQPTARDEMAAALRSLATLRHRQGRTTEAESLMERAMAATEQILGPAHPHLAATVFTLALIKDDLQKRDAAEALFRRSLSILEKALGEAHPQTGVVLSAMGKFYRDQRRYAEAEAMFKRALLIAERAFGNAHPRTGERLSDLASVYSAQNRYAEALPLLERSVTILDNAKDTVDRLHLANSLTSLGRIRRDQGKYQEAADILGRALSVREAVLGPDNWILISDLIDFTALHLDSGHPTAAVGAMERAHTLAQRALNADHPNAILTVLLLGRALLASGRVDEAEPLILQALAQTERIHGRDHEQVAYALYDVALLHQNRERLQAAEEAVKRALEIDERQRPDHPQTVSGLGLLGVILERMGHYEEATALSERILQIHERSPGTPDRRAVAMLNLASLREKQNRYHEALALYHGGLALIDTESSTDRSAQAAIVDRLGSLYRLMGQDDLAEPLLQRALAMRERDLGSDHPQVGSSLRTLAALQLTQGKYSESETLYQRALRIAERAWGEDHTDVAECLSGLTNVYLDTGRNEAAAKIGTRPLDIWEHVLGPNHRKVADGLELAARQRWAAGQYKDAEPLLLRALNIRKMALGPNNSEVGDTLALIVRLYRVLGRNDEAAALAHLPLQIWRAALGPEHPATAVGLDLLGDEWLRQGNLAAAETYYNEAAAIRIKSQNPSPVALADSHERLTRVYFLQNRWEEAAATAERGEKLVKDHLGADHPRAVEMLLVRSVIAGRRGTFAEFETLARDALTGLNRSLGADHPLTAYGTFNLALALQLQKKHTESLALYHRYLAAEGTPALRSEDVPLVLALVGTIYEAEGDVSKAEASYLTAFDRIVKAVGETHSVAGLAMRGIADFYLRTDRSEDAVRWAERAKAALANEDLARHAPANPADALVLPPPGMAL